MTEPSPTPAAHDSSDSSDSSDVGTTGHRGVDEVLGSLADLASRPVEDHLEVLSAAHERLHTTLDEHRDRDDDERAGDASGHP